MNKMKCCPICDREIKNKWCKNCKKFVTPYEVKETLHWNEGHDEANDADCNYHEETTLNASGYSIDALKAFKERKEAEERTVGENSYRLGENSAAKISSQNTQGKPGNNANTAKYKQLIAFSLIVVFIYVLISLLVFGIERLSSKKFNNKYRTTVTVKPIELVKNKINPPKEGCSQEEWRAFCEENDLTELANDYPFSFYESPSGMQYIFEDVDFSQFSAAYTDNTIADCYLEDVLENALACNMKKYSESKELIVSVYGESCFVSVYAGMTLFDDSYAVSLRYDPTSERKNISNVNLFGTDFDHLAEEFARVFAVVTGENAKDYEELFENALEQSKREGIGADYPAVIKACSNPRGNVSAYVECSTTSDGTEYAHLTIE